MSVNDIKFYKYIAIIIVALISDKQLSEKYGRFLFLWCIY